MIKKVKFTRHSLQQMIERGATEKEVEGAIYQGERVPAKKGRSAFRYNFQYNARWAGRYFLVKQVMPVVVQEHDTYVVVTVYTFYF